MRLLANDARPCGGANDQPARRHHRDLRGAAGGIRLGLVRHEAGGGCLAAAAAQI